jgi:hypothetical protein
MQITHEVNRCTYTIGSKSLHISIALNTKNSSAQHTQIPLCMQHTQIPLGHQEAFGDRTVHTFLYRLPKAVAKPRAVLAQSQVITIFQLMQNAVLDIWTARPWATETWHLDPARSIQRARSRAGSRSSAFDADWPHRCTARSVHW